MHMRRELPPGYVIIGKERHKQLETNMFNPAGDGLVAENRFSDRFYNEIASVIKACSEVLAQHGEFGSQDRYYKGLASDWWMDDDFHSASRVLFIDVLDRRMQTHVVMEGLRNILFKLPSDWMLMVGHDNGFDNRGQFVGEAGSYYFWIRKEIVEVYSERPEDIATFYCSIQEPR
jgi:hypothetical protein